jgi:hypothetical protein
MKIVSDTITLTELKELEKNGLGSLVKAVVDIERNLMAVDGQMHADEEQILLNDGSQQKNLWGINIYPDLPITDRIEFDSMINIRPSYGNSSRSVENTEIQDKIRTIVNRIITK